MVMLFIVFFFLYIQMGMFGLVGFVGMLVVVRVGKWVDQGWVQCIIGLVLVLLIILWFFIGYVEIFLFWLIVGVIVLDFVVQVVYVFSQSLIIVVRFVVVSCLVGVYMCFYLLGSVVGVIVVIQFYFYWGWQVVCFVGVVVSVCVFLIWLGLC